MYADRFSSAICLIAPRFVCVQVCLSSDHPFFALFRVHSQPVRRSMRSARSLVLQLSKSDPFAVVWSLVLLAGFVALSTPVWGDPVTPLSSQPDWDGLQKFRETLTHDQFVHLLDEVYAVGGTAHNCIKVEADYAEIRASLANFSFVQCCPVVRISA